MGVGRDRRGWAGRMSDAQEEQSETIWMVLVGGGVV